VSSAQHCLTEYIVTHKHTHIIHNIRGFGWRIHCGVEVTESSTNKQHILNTVSHTARSFGCMCLSLSRMSFSIDRARVAVYVVVTTCICTVKLLDPFF